MGIRLKEGGHMPQVPPPPPHPLYTRLGIERLNEIPNYNIILKKFYVCRQRLNPYLFHSNTIMLIDYSESFTGLLQETAIFFDVLEAILSHIMSNYNDYDVYLMGDFNLDFNIKDWQQIVTLWIIWH